MPTSLDAAKFFLSACDVDAGDLISNLKMQKLVYYAQGVHLATTGKRLFDEDIEAWEHGPVAPKLYDEFKKFGDKAIDLDFLDFSGYDKVLTEEQLEILADVYLTYGKFSAWALKDKTIEESPWKITANNGERRNRSPRGNRGLVIPDDLMIDHFKNVSLDYKRA
jgi:uncharacterized phage-associated protein